MARTRIIIGNVNKTTTKLLYHGPSGSAAEATMKADTTCQSFEIFEGPGRRKNNPNYKAGDEVTAATVNEVKEVKPEPAPETEALPVSSSESLLVSSSDSPPVSAPEAPESPPAEEPAAKAKSSKK